MECSKSILKVTWLVKEETFPPDIKTYKQQCGIAAVLGKMANQIE